jgi:hypothetical protein
MGLHSPLINDTMTLQEAQACYAETLKVTRWLQTYT